MILAVLALILPQGLAVRGDVVHTMAGPAIPDGIVLIEGGRITAVGSADELAVPDGWRVLEAAVVVPGLVDARSSVGLAGFLNIKHSNEEIERSAPIQPELSAVDAYNPRDPLVAWVRSFGVTAVNTGHAPGALISGQTMVVKTTGGTVAEALVKPTACVTGSLGGGARSGKSPGTGSKAVAMLRQELIRAREYADRRARKAEGMDEEDDGESGDAKPKGGRDLRKEALASVLDGEVPLLMRADRAHDIETVLRLREEFGFRLILEGAAEAYLLVDEIRAASVPVFLHPTMQRASGERKNLAMTTAATLRAAGIPVAIPSGYESYVPRTRVILFEAAIAARFGLAFDDALALVTIEPARILGVDDRVGSISPGKDADLALYDGDPFEYTTHCTAVVIDGRVVSDDPR